ncbi:hypothetical protein FKG94_02625 [Exilibacterium tricleocarpae]|uniref:Energy-coupling factor ABC transporter permease n=1 Tax=Exilibacterium tricleocarpae TaxID=2591008 RepID=A0A545U6K4_9GAMM|nr:energy-coupling factor ABC transporter permease [Exilibacterium tricleocarpae]TQV85105.1 hypothetical protein FKG94_02625 [Exilibacterium tricleocarpae]
MNILIAPDTTLFWTALATNGLFLAAALRYAPWHAVLRVAVRQHALLGATLALGVFWHLQVAVGEVIAIHPLAITTLTIVFGWSLAVVAGTLACGIFQLLGDGLWYAWPVDSLLSVILPASATWLVLLIIERITWKNLFTYMLGAGFAGAMLSVLACGAGALALFWLTGAQPLLAVTREHFYLYGLLMFPEGFINGAMVSVITVFWPQMVKTYDDDTYLGR